MKKVLYISNIEVPYRTEFFNQLSKKVELTVVYERKKSSNRNADWSASEKSNFKVKYLKGINYKSEFSIDFGISKLLKEENYDCVILGCYNSISQILLNYYMRVKKIKFLINVDGEYFISNGIKGFIKKQLLKGANGYLVAGETAATKMKQVLNKDKVYYYNFSSMTIKEINEHSLLKNDSNSNVILVVGQYLECKGLDLVLSIAKFYPALIFKFIGMGNKTDEFNELVKKSNLSNVVTIPFLEKELLNKEYQNCKCFMLPSRKECWGLVINEAASYGVPIISSQGNGAAIDFLTGKYEFFLSKQGDVDSLRTAFDIFLKYDHIKEYKEYLLDKSKLYTIEENVEKYLDVINKMF